MFHSVEVGLDGNPWRDSICYLSSDIMQVPNKFLYETEIVFEANFQKLFAFPLSR